MKNMTTLFVLQGSIHGGAGLGLLSWWENAGFGDDEEDNEEENQEES